MRTIGLGISLLIMSILLLEQPLGAQQLTAKEIITKADKKNRGETMKLLSGQNGSAKYQ